MLRMPPTWTALAPVSGCPPGGDSHCPADLPPLPDSMVLTIQVALACAVALIVLGLVAASVICGGLCLLLALKASDAFQPFARLHVPAGPSYNDRVMRAGSGPVWAFAETMRGFRGWLILLVFALIGLTATAFVQAASAIHRHRWAPPPADAASAPDRGMPAI